MLKAASSLAVKLAGDVGKQPDPSVKLTPVTWSEACCTGKAYSDIRTESRILEKRLAKPAKGRGASISSRGNVRNLSVEDAYQSGKLTGRNSLQYADMLCRDVWPVRKIAPCLQAFDFLSTEPLQQQPTDELQALAVGDWDPRSINAQ